VVPVVVPVVVVAVVLPVVVAVVVPVVVVPVVVPVVVVAVVVPVVVVAVPVVVAVVVPVVVVPVVVPVVVVAVPVVVVAVVVPVVVVPVVVVAVVVPVVVVPVVRPVVAPASTSTPGPPEEQAAIQRIKRVPATMGPCGDTANFMSAQLLGSRSGAMGASAEKAGVPVGFLGIAFAACHSAFMSNTSNCRLGCPNWHLAHQTHCACRPIPPELASHIDRGNAMRSSQPAPRK
jgi:signal-induced proliferation-associated 1 like protein 3